MKKFLSSCVFAFLTVSAFSQSGDPQNKKVITDSEPAYPKGEQALYSEVMYSIKYSEEAKSKYLEGEVTIGFDVKPDSTVSNITIISGVGYGVDEEIKKYIEKLKFAPAVQNGRKVKMSTMYTFPIKAH